MHKHEEAKEGISSKGQPMHYSAGAIIKKDGKYLLIERAHPPYGFAGPAGHIDKGETPEEAVKREVREETGLIVAKSSKLLQKEVQKNTCICTTGITVHHWHLFECVAAGIPKRNQQETKSIGWYTPAEIKKLTLEPVWKYWLTKLKII